MVAKSLSSSKVTPTSRSKALSTMGRAAYSQSASSHKMSSPSKTIAGSVLAQSRPPKK